MARRQRGLYEALVTEVLAAELEQLGDRLQSRQSPLHEAEAADRIALHLSRVLERAVASLDEVQAVGLALADGG